MVSLKITENDIIKVLLAILGSWRWGPYGGPDHGDRCNILLTMIPRVVFHRIIELQPILIPHGYTTVLSSFLLLR
jgi:hypothetical protein